MKYAKLFFFIFFAFAASVNSAMIWEFGIRVQDSSNNLISRAVYVYGYNSSTKNYEELCSVWSQTNTIVDSWNVIFNVSGISGDYSSASATLANYSEYVFKIGNDYSRNVVSFGQYYYDITMTYTEGSGWGSASNGSQSTGTWSMQTITLKNKMGNDYESVSGLIKLNSENITTGYSGVEKTREASTFPHTIYAENQTVVGVDRKWREWVQDGSTSMSKVISSASSPTLTARYARQYSASISTNLGGGVVYVNGSSYSCPTSTSYIYDDLNNSVTASNQEYNNFSCTFDHWNSGGSFYSSQNTLYFDQPSNSVSLEAVFTLKISNVGEGLSFGSVQDDPIVLYWNDNPNATGYQIWRKVKINGVWQSPYQIATVSTGLETYTDGDYKLNAWHTGTELEYDA